MLPGQECLASPPPCSSVSETRATGPLQPLVPVLSSVPRCWWSVRKFIEECIKSRLKVVKVRRGLMAGGTTLYSAEALEAKELNLRLLTLVYLEDPSGRIHVVPYREVSRKLMFILFGARLL